MIYPKYKSAPITTFTENFRVKNILATAINSQMVKRENASGESLNNEANGIINKRKQTRFSSLAKRAIDAKSINATIENKFVDITPNTISVTSKRQIGILYLLITVLNFSLQILSIFPLDCA
jgi:hypothetical protein